jgi:hypothetical protein
VLFQESVDAGTRETEAGTGDGVHRRGSGSRQAGATEAAAHRTSDLKKSQAFKSCAPRRRLRKEVQYATRKKTSVGTYG